MACKITGWVGLIVLFGVGTITEGHSVTVNGLTGNDDLSCYNGTGKACKTLDYALANGLRSNTIVDIAEGQYSLKWRNLSFHDLCNTSIHGAGRDVTIVKCDSGVGLNFQNLTQVKLANFSLIGGGLLSNSTSVNRTSNEPALFRTALYFLDCTDVELDGMAVSNSTGTGVALYDVTGNVSVTNSIFAFNKVLNDTEQMPGGGGIYAEFTVNKSSKVNVQYMLCHCSFTGNTAISVENVDTPSSTRQHTAYYFQQFGSGGGLSVNLRSSVHNGVFSVRDCNFTNNIAVWGGGIHFMVLNNSKGNQFFVESSHFNNNHCPYNATMTSTGTGGGGIRFQFFPEYGSDYNHSVELKYCTFTNNSAYYGGGFSINLVREKNVSSSSTKVRIVECSCNNNAARTGSAVDIYLNDFPIGMAPTVFVINCTFRHNSNVFLLNSINLLGVGALYTRSVPIRFYGINTFIGNHGSAIAATGTKFIFCNHSISEFRNNTGRQGGGIALLGVSYIKLCYNTTISFSGNYAIVKGGAIYSLVASERDFINSQNCFILYYDANESPYEWKTNVSFTENNSPVGKSIYCTTLLACVWSKQAEGTRADEEEIKEVFYWNGTFSYSGINNSKDLNDEICTAASEISHHSDSDGPLRIPPGKAYRLNVTALDDRQSSVNTVYLIKSNRSSHCIVSNSSMYSSDAVIKLEGDIGCNVTIDIQTINARPLSLSIQVVTGECPPGFYISKQGRVICRCSLFRHAEEFRGIANCDENDFVAYLRPEYWAGYTLVNNTQVLITGICPAGYCYRNETLLLRLPDTPSNEALDELLCKPQNRTGRLCGRCSEGHHICVHLLDFHCIKCSPQQINGIIILLLTKYLPLTVFLCIIMFFNISLVNGPLNSFILFSQALDAMDIYISDSVAEPSSLGGTFIAIYIFLYGIWNLNFLEMVIPPFCIFKTTTALPLVTLEYAVAIYTLLVLVVLFLLAPKIKEKLFATDDHSLRGCKVTMKRCYERYIHLKKSANYRQGESIHAFTTLLVLCYVKLMMITMDILTPNELYGPGAEYSNVQIKVVWVDGTLRYLDGTHSIYAAVAFLCLFTCVLIPPLLLLSYPYLPMLINKLNCHNNKILQKLCITPLDKYVPFFDAFQSCYKNEYRFFAGLYFIYRIIALCISSLSPSMESQYIGQSIFYTGVLMIHCLCQPYKKRSHNIIDGLIFTNMIIINSLSAYRYYWYATNLSKTTQVFWIQLIMIYLPVICLVGVIVYKMIRRSGCFKYGYVELEDSLPSRLLDDVEVLNDDAASNNNLSNGYHLMDAASNIECSSSITSSVAQQHTIP